MRSPLRVSAVLLVAAFLVEPLIGSAPATRAGEWTDASAEIFIARLAQSRAKKKETPSGDLIACIAKRPATARQRRIALRRARAAYKRMTAARRAAARRRSRYLAIQTERDAQAKGVITCMVFDTRTLQIVGEKVYDCESVPPIGAGLKFESFIATYVGS